METILQSPQGPSPSMAPIFDMLAASAKLIVLEAALELNITGILADHSDIDGIAGEIGVKTDRAALGYFLDTVVALGMAEKKNGLYFNTDFARAFFLRESPVYMGGLLKNLKGMQHKNLPKIVEIIKQGPPDVPPEQVLESEEKWREAVENISPLTSEGAWGQSALILLKDCRSLPMSKKSLIWAVAPELSVQKF